MSLNLWKLCYPYISVQTPGLAICNRAFASAAGCCARLIMTTSTFDPHLLSAVQEIFTPSLKHLKDTFDEAGYEIRIAGGAVRDILMKKKPEDVDFATTANPEEMKRMFDSKGIRMLSTTGEKHGTITARIGEENFEVTTLRIDKVTYGRHAEVEFIKDWKMDAERRDLTINSMFLDFDGRLYDYFNGRSDLENRRVLFVGNAEQRIQEDYLRILRYFRFFGRIAEDAESYDRDTLEAIRNNGQGLKNISGERIWTELKKIVATGNFLPSIFKCIYQLGLPEYIGLPLPGDLDELERVVERCRGLEPKPMTIVSSLADTDTQIVEMDRRLRLSRDEKRLGEFILHFRNLPLPHQNPAKPYKDFYVQNEKTPHIMLYIREVLKHRGRTDILEMMNSWKIPQFPINGHDLMEAGAPRGKSLSRIFNSLRVTWCKSDYQLSKEDLIVEAKKLIQEIAVASERPEKNK